MAGRRILIVDDEASVCDVMATILEGAGYSVYTATDGLEALGEIKREVPSLLVLDLLMPGMSGWDVLRALRQNKRTRNISVVVMSSDRDTLARARALSAKALVGKPFQLSDLLRIVEQSLPRPRGRRGCESEALASSGAAPGHSGLPSQ